MRGFDSNNCRLCDKVFCCEKCRVKHETKVHNVFPDCDICVYGTILLENLVEDSLFLHHLKTAHWPLHCVYCKKIFPSTDELAQHRKCPLLQRKEDSPKTPFKEAPPGILVSLDDQDSPILQELQRKEALNYMFNLATSTPMQKGEELVQFEKSREVITPVDRPSRGANPNKSIIKKSDSSNRSDQSSKRRVTFYETPVANSAEKIMNKGIPEETNKETTNGSSISTGPFYSAKMDFSEKSRKNNSINKIHENCTPVSVPNPGKMFNVKGDIYTKNNNSENNSPEIETTDSSKNEEDSKPKCANISTPVLMIQNTGNIYVKENNHVTTESISPEKISESNENTNKHIEENKNDDRPEGCNTLWLSATNLEEESEKEDHKKQDKENRKPELSVDTSTPPKTSTHRRVSIVMPTPIMKRTNVHMKIQFPLHLSSTPIITPNVLIQEKLVRDVPTHKIAQRSPVKQPQPNPQRLALKKQENVQPIVFSEPQGVFTQELLDYSVQKTEDSRNIVPLKLENPSEENLSSSGPTSVGLMTESSLWSSMTRIVKSVMHGFTNISQESSVLSNTSGSFKRHLSDSEPSDELVEAPRLKRFKFTDIKCRRPIRQLPEIDLPRKLSQPAGPMASIEIMKSVSTFYQEARVRVQIDKATQTDDYLLIGWKKA